MLKFTYMFGLAAVGVMFGPRMAPQAETVDVEEALRDTVSALRELTRVQEALNAGEPQAIDRVLTITEAAAPDARTRDEFLVTLRQEVSRLQLMADELGVPPPVAMHGAPGLQPLSGSASQAADEGRVATGMSDELLRSISRSELPLSRVSDNARRNAGNALSFEPEGYSADVVQQARLFYRGGRYAEALTVLEAQETSAEVEYWIARCLERMERTREALERYRRLADDPDGGPIALRAARDHDFLSWKQKFEQTHSQPDQE